MNESNKFLVPIAIVIAGALITWGFISNKNDQPKQTNNDDNKPKTELSMNPSPVSDNDHILGNPNAEIIMIEYSDLECPFCKSYYFTTKKLMDDFGKDGKLAIVFRHFPLDQLHSQSRKEATATECSAKLGGNGKFWEYMDELFATTPSNNGLDLAKLPAMAEKIGLNKTEFENCLNDKTMAEKVESYFQDGIKAGVLGTPAEPGGTPYSLLISKDGKMTPVKGGQPYEVVKMMIENILAQ